MATRSAISETKKTKTVKKTGEEAVKETPLTVGQTEKVKSETEKAEPAEKPVKAAAKPVEAAAEKKEETKAPEKKTPEKKTSTRTAAKKTTTKKEAAPKKETAKKATTKKETVKKETTVKKTASKKEIKVNAIVEHYGRQISEQDIIANVKRAWTNSGKNEKDIKSIELYIKPEENAVYYVVNETETGAVALYE